MKDYVGKICPFCKTEIKEEDEVMVCPECEIPHHKACWDENGGCTTFGCSMQKNEKPAAEAPETQENPVAQEASGKRICKNCGAELAENQQFCHKCGQKAELEIAPETTNAINQFNSVVEKNNESSKKKPVIIASVVGVIALLGIIIGFLVSSGNAEKNYDNYIADANEFLDLSINAGANLEDIADTVQRYWYENIWEDRHGYTIDDAIDYALSAKSSEISEAKTYDGQMKDLYSRIKRVPKVKKDKQDIVEDINEAAKELYNIYTDYYSMAVSPSGSYDSYSAENSKKTDEFLSKYRALKNLLS